jgi:hypothetical protein
MTQLFTARPCGEVVSTIDWLNTAEPPNLLDEASTQKFIEGAGILSSTKSAEIRLN